MTRERYAVDGNLLVVTLLQNYFGDRVTVAVSSDVDTIDHLPFIVVDARQGQKVPGSSHAMAWQWSVELEFLADGIEECADIADETHEMLEAIQSAWDGRGIIPGIGAITGVEVTSIPTKTGSTELPAGNLTQFHGSFDILTQKA
jgi:hypothetical protein